jgi:hypothetical protein
MSTMMPDNQIATLKLEFARQLYDRSLERHGQDHEHTRLLLDYISALESRTSSASKGPEQSRTPLLPASVTPVLRSWYLRLRAQNSHSCP